MRMLTYWSACHTILSKDLGPQNSSLNVYQNHMTIQYHQENNSLEWNTSRITAGFSSHLVIGQVCSAHSENGKCGILLFLESAKRSLLGLMSSRWWKREVSNCFQLWDARHPPRKGGCEGCPVRTEWISRAVSEQMNFPTKRSSGNMTQARQLEFSHVWQCMLYIVLDVFRGWTTAPIHEGQCCPS